MSVTVVTGAAGFVGDALCEALLARGHEVRGIDLRPTVRDGVTSFVGDLSTDGPWRTAFEGADLVVHAAAIVAESGDRDRFIAVNVGGTRRALEAAADAGVARVVALSSIVVYGNRAPTGAMLSEDAPLVPTGTPYTDTKIGAEHAAMAVALERGLPLTVVRPGDVYGPRSVPWVIRPLDLMRRKLFAHVDGGRWPLSPIHVDDLVVGVLLAAEASGAVGRSYNLAGPPVPSREFFGHHARHLGVHPRDLPAGLVRSLAWSATFGGRAVGREVPFSPEAVEYVTHRSGYATVRARTELGWAPKVELADGLARSFAAVDATARPAATA